MSFGGRVGSRFTLASVVVYGLYEVTVVVAAESEVAAANQAWSECEMQL